MAAALRDRGVRASTVRLPPSVHGAGDHGFVPILIDMARRTGRSAHVAGGNAWSAVHVVDAGRAFALALEDGAALPVYHAAAEARVPFGVGLDLPVVEIPPEDAPAQFDWFAGFATLDAPADATLTRARLGWSPDGLGLIEDIRTAGYFDAPT